MLKHAPPERHGELNSLTERHIQSLKNLACAGLFDAGLTDRFWLSALRYAILIKNSLPHAGLRGKTPLEIAFLRKPQLKSLKRFGPLRYSLILLEKRKNKFNLITIPKIFLGFDVDSSFDTTTLCDPSTKKMSHKHMQDIYYNEQGTFRDHVERFQCQVDLPTKQLEQIHKHTLHLMEGSDTDSVIDSSDEHTTENTSNTGDSKDQTDSAHDSTREETQTAAI